MHESAIAKSILEIIHQRLSSLDGSANAQRVMVIFGEFRNADPESVQFAFDNMKGFFAGCSDCELLIQTIPAKAYCNDSKHVYHPMADVSYRCPDCGSGIGTLVQGEEMDVVNVVVEIDSMNKEKENARVT